MGDIFQEIDEDLRRDRYEELWKKYGNYLLTVVGVIIAATAGWVAWQEYEQRNAVTVTANMHSAISAYRADKPDEAIAALASISQEGTSGQAALAALQEAALRAQQGDRDNARVLYRSLRENSSLAPHYQALASIRAVELDLASGDPAELLAMLQPLTDDASPWRAVAWELAAYLEQRAGNTDAARDYLKRIGDDDEASAAARARAEAFLAQL